LIGNKKDLSRVAFWLVPRRQQRQELQTLIKALAKRFSAPAFVPHVTVYSCRRSVKQHELAVMAALAGNCTAVAFGAAGIAGKDLLTQALFVKLTPDAFIRSLYRTLHSAVPYPSAYELTPHLSLLYQKLPTTVREELVRATTLPWQTFHFDELWAVAIPEQLKTLDDCVGWQPLVGCRLASVPFVDTIEY
jgi:2'-5' RNA ligase